MSEEENYKKSCDLWVRMQKRIIKENKLTIKFAKKDLKLTHRTLIDARETLEHEKKRLSDFLTKINK